MKSLAWPCVLRSDMVNIGKHEIYQWLKRVWLKAKAEAFIGSKLICQELPGKHKEKWYKPSRYIVNNMLKL